MKLYSKSSGEFIILYKLPNDRCIVKFLDTGTEAEVIYGNALKGTIKDHHKRTCCGVGFLGEGRHRRYNTKAGMYWQFMLNRCYLPKYKEQHPTYEDCVVCDYWHNFQNFAEWCSYQTGCGIPNTNLDKDLLLKGNKVYGPDTCCFLPQEINKAITKQTLFKAGLPIGVTTRDDLGGKYMARLSLASSGRPKKEKYLGLFATPELAFGAYKQAKEEQIKFLANKFRDRLTGNAYTALMEFEVNIED